MTGVSAGPYMRNLGTPYKIGFQPQGVRNDRTEEYMEARRAVEAGREVEEGRLSRRWAKVWMFCSISANMLIQGTILACRFTFQPNCISSSSSNNDQIIILELFIIVIGSR